jgi:hypothetical protein
MDGLAPAPEKPRRVRPEVNTAQSIASGRGDSASGIASHDREGSDRLRIPDSAFFESDMDPPVPLGGNSNVGGRRP